jgi:WD40 repeat protein
VDEEKQIVSKGHSSGRPVATETVTVASTADGESGGGGLPHAQTLVATGGPFDPAADPLRWVDGRDYQIESEQGRGGIGVVYRARDVRLDRVVALKELQQPDAGSQARFEREMRITARLQHPGVVPVHEAGRWATGEPFYAMKLVEGRPLKDIVAERVTLAERLSLLPNLVAVADTVAYAHEQGVIHRDLKPSNVILGDFGETVVVDWGLAKHLGESDGAQVDDGPFRTAADPSLTMTGAVIGTPAYMSPEQARGEEVAARSDIYSLGALLYHVLTAHPPYGRSGASDSLSRIVRGPPPPVESIEPGVPSELATIVSKAMARDPADRYPTAKALVEDLRRFHTGQLVSAHAYSRRDLVRRWLRRHRVVVSAAAVALLAVGLIGALSVTRIIRERERARDQQARAEAAGRDSEQRANALVLLQARTQLDRDPAAAVAWLKQYPAGADDWTQARDLLLDARSRIVARHVLGAGKNAIQAAAFSPDGALAATGGTDRLVRVWDVRTGALLRQRATSKGVHVLLASRDGRYLAAASGAEAVDVFDWNLKAVASLTVPGGSMLDISFAPDSSTLAAAGGGSRAVHLIDLKSGRAGAVLRDTALVRAVQFVDAATLLSGGASGALRRWHLADGSSEVLVDGLGEVFDVDLGDDRRTAVAGDRDGHVVVLDLQTRHVLRKQDHAGRVESVAIAPDGAFASTGQDGTVRLYDRGGASRALFRHDSEVYSLSFSADGRRLVSSGLDRTVRVWDVVGPSSWTLRGHTSAVNASVPSPDGAWLLSVSHDTTARLWPMPQQRSRVANEHEDDIYKVVFSRDGRYLATPSRDGTVGIAEVGSKQRWLLTGHRDLVPSVDFFPDGRRCASASWDGTVRVWDVVERRQLRELAVGDVRLWSVAVSPDGGLVAAGDVHGVVHLWDTRVWSHRTLPTSGRDAWTIAFSPDGRRLAVGTGSGALHAWETATWKQTRLAGHTADVSTMRFLDGDRLVTGSSDGRVRRWDLRTGSSDVLMSQADGINDVALGAGRDLVAAASDDHIVALWREGRTTLLRGHQAKVRGVAFSPDDSLLVSAAEDGSIRLWDASDGRLLDVLSEHTSFVMDVAVSPDGRTVASASIDRTVRLWPARATASPGSTPAELGRTMAALTSFDIPGAITTSQKEERP